MNKLTIISLQNDVYLAAIKLVLRAEIPEYTEDFLFMLTNPDKDRQQPIVIQEWIEECKFIVCKEMADKVQGVTNDNPVCNPVDSSVPAPVADNVQCVPASVPDSSNDSVAAPAVVADKPVAKRKSPAKKPSTPSPVVVEPAAEVNPIIAKAQAEVKAEFEAKVLPTQAEINASPMVEVIKENLEQADLLSPTVETVEIPVPEIVKFCSTDKAMVKEIYTPLDVLKPGWRNDTPFITHLKGMLSELNGLHFKASKDSTTFLRGFSLKLQDLVELAEKKCR